MIHVSAKHAVFGVPVRGDVLGIFPDAKRLTMEGNDFLLLPHKLDHVRVCRNLGLPIPAPILTQYDWAGGTPYDVQAKTAAMLTTHLRAYVLNGMGTGKTKSAIWSYDFLRTKGYAKRMLVVAPLSTLNFTWAREIFMTCPHLDVTVLHGTAERRLKRLAEPHDVYVINPAGLEIIESELAKRDDINVITIDELAQFRNGSSERTKTMLRIAQNKTWVWGMTGSPTPQSPTDAWAQCRIITPDTVPRYFGQFREQVMTKVTQFKFSSKQNAAEVVTSVMKPAVRYTLDDVVELPDVIERTMDIDLGIKQKRVYDELRKAAASMVDSNEITAVNAAGVLNKLLQVSLGFVYAKDRQVINLNPDARLDALSDIVASAERKVIIFSPYTHALDGIVTRLGKDKVDFRRVCGNTTAKERNLIFPLFQNTDAVKVLAAHPNTMSHGLTLTAADTIVWYGPTTSLEVFEQANARIRRIGQTHKQQIIMLQATAAERKIYTLLRAKQKIQNSILELFALNT